MTTKKPPLKVRALSRLVGTHSLSKMDEVQFRKSQDITVNHNLMTDSVMGRMAPDVVIAECSVHGADGPLTARIYTLSCGTAKNLPILVKFHGGGWAIGGIDQTDWICNQVASRVGAVVISVAYRLAPDHRWSAGPEDSYAAVVDVVERAGVFGGESERVAVMGDSFGHVGKSDGQRSLGAENRPSGTHVSGDRPDLVLIVHRRKRARSHAVVRGSATVRGPVPGTNRSPHPDGFSVVR